MANLVDLLFARSMPELVDGHEVETIVPEFVGPVGSLGDQQILDHEIVEVRADEAGECILHRIHDQFGLVVKGSVQHDGKASALAHGRTLTSDLKTP